MRWLARCLLWTAAFAFPCFLLAAAYQRGLMATTATLLGIRLRAGQAGSVDLAAINVLGLYAAMCLASRRAPAGRRWWALGLGLAGLACVEVIAGIISVNHVLRHSDDIAGAAPISTLATALLNAQRWVGAPLLWLLTLGQWELPGARRLPKRRALKRRVVTAGKLPGRDGDMIAAPKPRR